MKPADSYLIWVITISVSTLILSLYAHQTFAWTSWQWYRSNWQLSWVQMVWMWNPSWSLYHSHYHFLSSAVSPWSDSASSLMSLIGLSHTIFTHFDVAVRAVRLAVYTYLLGAPRQCLFIEHGLVRGVPSLLIVYIAESFQIFSVFCSSTVPHPLPLFDLLQFNFLLVSFRCFRVHLHHILLQFFLLALTILYLKLVVELLLDFWDASILEFLPEKQSFQSYHLSVFLRELLGVKIAFQSLNLLFLHILFSLHSLSFQTHRVFAAQVQFVASCDWLRSVLQIEVGRRPPHAKSFQPSWSLIALAHGPALLAVGTCWSFSCWSRSERHIRFACACGH